jgi:hypothetical protein
MGTEAAAAFDGEMRRMVGPHAVRGVLRLSATARVRWGRAVKVEDGM